jgi:hypothetical protein
MATQAAGAGDAPRDKVRTRERARGAASAASPMPQLGVILLGVLMVLVGAALVYGLVATWPAVDAATGDKPVSKKISLFGVSYTTTPSTALILLVVFASALGSYVHAATSFTDYVGNRRLARSWTWWYILRVFVGTALALLFYFAVRGGFIGADTPDNVINPYGIGALAGLVGLFSKQATDKLRELFDTLFRVAPGSGDDARGDSIANPVPVIAGIDPPVITVGKDAVQLTLAGEGFVPESVVRVSRPEDDPPVFLERETQYLSPTELAVTLSAEDVAAVGALDVTVLNPPPSGGASGPTRVEVREE